MYWICSYIAPDEPIEKWTVIDTAILRAKKLSLIGFDYIVVDVDTNTVKAFAHCGRMEWAKPCPRCAGAGLDWCGPCQGIGALPEHEP